MVAPGPYGVGGPYAEIEAGQSHGVERREALGMGVACDSNGEEE